MCIDVCNFTLHNIYILDVVLASIWEEHGLILHSKWLSLTSKICTAIISNISCDIDGSALNGVRNNMIADLTLYQSCIDALYSRNTNIYIYASMS